MAVTPNSIITPQGVQANTAVATLANTNYTVPTNFVELVAAGPNGARVVKLQARPNATVTATECQEFRDKDGTGTNRRFTGAMTMAAHTKVQTAAPPITDFGYSDGFPALLAPNEKLYVAIGVAGSITFIAEWENF